MSEKMKNLMVRTLSGAVLAVVMLGATLLSQWTFGALLLVMLIGGMLEFYLLSEKQGNTPQIVMGLTTGVVLLLLNFALATGVDFGDGFQTLYIAGLALLLLLVPMMFVCELYRKHDNPVAGIATTLLGVFYVAVPLSLLCFIPIVWSDSWNPWVMLFYILIIWSNDVFAYLVGMTIGRHRLFERLSPKKSWEGFFGGLVGAVAMGLFAAYMLDMNCWIWGGLALIAAVSGVLGDLVESMFKRASDVKDSGSLIPGHGGVLDRFDALLLSAPFVFVYMLFFM